MSCFADGEVSPQDLGLLQDAFSGDKQALRLTCNRFKHAVLALALRECSNIELAVDVVEPVLRVACRDLLKGSVEPEHWSQELARRVKDQAAELRTEQHSDSGDEGQLSGLTSVPRIARRRAVRTALLNLPVDELMAITLHYVGQMSPGNMVGLIAGDEEQAAAKLASAHRRLLADVTAHLAQPLG